MAITDERGERPQGSVATGVLDVRGVEADDFLKVEQYSLEPVSAADRHGNPKELFLLWTGAMANYASLFTGSLLVATSIGVTLGVFDAFIAIVIGSILAAIMHGLLSNTGPRSGATQMLFSRAVYGLRGSFLGPLFTWIMAVGWFAVDCVIATSALNQLAGLAHLPQGKGTTAILATLVIVASVAVAVYGHQTVKVFENYGAIVFMGFCVLLFVVLAPKFHWNTAAAVHGPAHLANWVLGASILYSLVASWIPFASDYSRYLPASSSTRSVTLSAGLGIAVPTILLGMFGLLIQTIDPANQDLLGLITKSAPPWLAVPFLVFVVLGEVWANYFDVYTAGLVALAMNVPLKRWLSAIACGIVGALLVYYAEFIKDVSTAYTNFLLLTYLWVPAWAAIILVDFFIFRKGRYQADQLLQRGKGAYWYNNGFFWPAFISWMVGFAAAFPFVNSTLYQSPLSTYYLGGADLSGFVGAVVGAGLYYLLGRNQTQRG